MISVGTIIIIFRTASEASFQILVFTNIYAKFVRSSSAHVFSGVGDKLYILIIRPVILLLLLSCIGAQNHC